MLSIENFQNKLAEEQLKEIVKKSLKDFSSVKKVLLIHPDYTRTDFNQNRL
jgi:nickel-dependent lactate racemase